MYPHDNSSNNCISDLFEGSRESQAEWHTSSWKRIIRVRKSATHQFTFRQGRNESFVCDPITAHLGMVGLNTKSIWNLYGDGLYFCTGSCSCSEIKAYVGPEEWEIKGVVWTDGKKRCSLVLNVTIPNIQLSDTGIYYCGWDRTGKDGYQEVRIEVIPQDADILIRNVITGLSPG